MPDKFNLTQRWLVEKLSAPELWSVRDRDDIVYYSEKKRGELASIPEAHQPMRQRREDELAVLEAAMDSYIQSTELTGRWPEAEPAILDADIEAVDEDE